jgi:hypothetical protein
LSLSTIVTFHIASFAGIYVFLGDPPYNETSPYQPWTMMLMVSAAFALILFPSAYVLLWYNRSKWFSKRPQHFENRTCAIASLAASTQPSPDPFKSA